jgi:hypothetical protein
MIKIPNNAYPALVTLEHEATRGADERVGGESIVFRLHMLPTTRDLLLCVPQAFEKDSDHASF